MSGAPTQNRDFVEINDWPDELVRAVAIFDPQLIKAEEGVFAVADDAFDEYALDSTRDAMYETEHEFFDLEGYGAQLRVDDFLPFEIDGETWWVRNYPGDKIRCAGQSWDDEYIKFPIDPEKLGAVRMSEWPQGLLIAVAQTMPDVLFAYEPLNIAVREADAAVWVMATVFDYSLWASVMEFFDGFGCVAQHLASDYVRIELDGDVWFVERSVPENDRLDRWHGGDDDTGGRSFLGWTDEMLLAVATDVPEALSENDRESLYMFPESLLEAKLDEWMQWEAEYGPRWGCWQELEGFAVPEPAETDTKTEWVHNRWTYIGPAEDPVRRDARRRAQMRDELRKVSVGGNLWYLSAP